MIRVQLVGMCMRLCECSAYGPSAASRITSSSGNPANTGCGFRRYGFPPLSGKKKKLSQPATLSS